MLRPASEGSATPPARETTTFAGDRYRKPAGETTPVRNCEKSPNAEVPTVVS